MSRTSTVASDEMPQVVSLTSARIRVSTESKEGSEVRCELRFLSADGSKALVRGAPFRDGEYDVTVGLLFHSTIGEGASTLHYS